MREERRKVQKIKSEDSEDKNEEVTASLKLVKDLSDEEKRIWEDEKEAIYNEWMCCDRTKLLLKFFKSELRFTDN